jgi:hypothetical protein
MTPIASFLKRLLSPRRSQPRSSEGPVYPLGLNQEQVASLRKLGSTPQWQTYTEALTAVCEREMGLVLSGLPHDQYLLKVGRIQALTEVITLPTTIDLKAKEIDEHRSTAPDPARRERSDLAFYGSDYYSRRT